MSVRAQVLLALLCLPLVSPPARADGALGQIRAEEKKSDPAGSTAADGKAEEPGHRLRVVEDQDRQAEEPGHRLRVVEDQDCADRESCSEDDDGDSLGGMAIVLFFFTLPHSFWEHGVGMGHRAGGFPSHPYKDGNDGYMLFAKQPEPPPDGAAEDPGSEASVAEAAPAAEPEPAPPGHPVALRATAEYGYLLSDLHRLNARFLLSTRTRFDLDSTWTYFRENRASGPVDELIMGDLNLVYRFAQHENVQYRAGVGARMQIDRGDVLAGFNLTYGVDIYPRKPWALAIFLNLGSLGEAVVFEPRVEVGWLVGAYEFHLGWQALLIGDTTLQGPVAGVSAHF